MHKIPLTMHVLTRHLRNGVTIAEKDEGCGVITIGFVNTLVSDAVTGTTVIPTLYRYRFLAVGTGSAAEAETQTALGTEVGSRNASVVANGQTATGGNHAAILSYVATYTNALGGTTVIAEAGLFDVVTSSTGNMMDRKLVGPYSLVSGDQLQITFLLTLPSGN